MNRCVYVTDLDGPTRVAAFEDGQLVRYISDDAEKNSLVGQIFLGRVERVVPSLGAAFIDIGQGLNGFLRLSDMPVGARPRAGDTDQSLLKAGQEIIVQVEKDPVGDKGPRLTGDISLPGHTVVFKPYGSGIGVSRHIGDETARAALRERALSIYPGGSGLILRTEAAQAGDDELKSEISALVGQWDSIAQRASHLIAPVRLDAGQDALSLCAREFMTACTSRVLVEGETAFEFLKQAAGSMDPRYADRIEPYRGEAALFDLMKVDALLEKACARKIWLPSGGYLIVDRTEALTVIDVNTGKNTSSRAFEDSVLALNLEAADEIARLMRLLDIGGIIIIDFIDMGSETSKRALLARLRERFEPDKAQPTVHGITALGLVEVTRQRRGVSLLDQITAPCPVCRSSGRVVSADWTLRAIRRALNRKAREGKTDAVILTVPVPLADMIAQWDGFPNIDVYIDRSGRHVAWSIEPALGEADKAGRVLLHRTQERS